MEPVLDVRDLEVRFFTYFGIVYAVNGVSYRIGVGETAGIVGESGSGKSVSAMSVMGLVQQPGYVTAGTIRFQGRDLLAHVVVGAEATARLNQMSSYRGFDPTGVCSTFASAAVAGVVSSGLAFLWHTKSARRPSPMAH